MSALEADIAQNQALVEGAATKMGALANRVFQLEEQRGADESVWSFNAIVCNASIQMLRQEFAAYLKGQKQMVVEVNSDEVTTSAPTVASTAQPAWMTSPPMQRFALDGVLEEANELLKSANERYTRLEQVVSDTFRGLRATDRGRHERTLIYPLPVKLNRPFFLFEQN